MLAVQVGEEVLRALGQAQHGAQMRHLRGGLLNGPVLLAQQVQIPDILRGKGFFSHATSLRFNDCFIRRAAHPALHPKPSFAKSTPSQSQNACILL